MTIWAEIPDFEGYEISEEGQVRSFHRLKKRSWYQIIYLKPHSNHGQTAYWLFSGGHKYERNQLALMKLCF